MVRNDMSIKDDTTYLKCPGCGWIHEVVHPSSKKDELKYSHCCNCFEDYINFEEAVMDDIIKHTNKQREFGKILMP